MNASFDVLAKGDSSGKGTGPANTMTWTLVVCSTEEFLPLQTFRFIFQNRDVITLNFLHTSCCRS